MADKKNKNDATGETPETAAPEAEAQVEAPAETAAEAPAAEASLPPRRPLRAPAEAAADAPAPEAEAEAPQRKRLLKRRHRKLLPKSLPKRLLLKHRPKSHARPDRAPRGRGGRGGGGGGRGGRDGNRRDGRRGRGGDDDGGEELIEKLVHINRVSKTVKGGKRFGFAALVVVGDGKGRAGFGHGKAREVPEAISKATAAAKKAMVRVPLRDGRTLHHDGKGHFGAGKVTVRSAPSGTGIIAGGPMRAVFESLGVADVVTKSVGTSNPYNMIRATFEALKEQTSPRAVAQRRGKKVADLLGRGGASDAEAEAQAEAIAE